MIALTRSSTWPRRLSDPGQICGQQALACPKAESTAACVTPGTAKDQRAVTTHGIADHAGIACVADRGRSVAGGRDSSAILGPIRNAGSRGRFRQRFEPKPPDRNKCCRYGSIRGHEHSPWRNGSRPERQQETVAGDSRGCDEPPGNDPSAAGPQSGRPRPDRMLRCASFADHRVIRWCPASGPFAAGLPDLGPFRGVIGRCIRIPSRSECSILVGMGEGQSVRTPIHMVAKGGPSSGASGGSVDRVVLSYHLGGYMNLKQRGWASSGQPQSLVVLERVMGFPPMMGLLRPCADLWCNDCLFCVASVLPRSLPDACPWSLSVVQLGPQGRATVRVTHCSVWGHVKNRALPGIWAIILSIICLINRGKTVRWPHAGRRT